MDYRGIFEDAVDTLRAEKRYRVFADLERIAGRFPRAIYRDQSDNQREITIWCSNDYLGMGNLSINPNVGLLFIALHGRPRRMRVNGTARIERDDPLLGATVGAQLIVRVKARAIFPNCPRYIPHMQLVEESRFIPHAGEDFVEPGWKDEDVFCDVIHPRAETFRG